MQDELPQGDRPERATPTDRRRRSVAPRQRLPDPLPVVGLLLLPDPALPDPVELDVEPPDDDLSESVLPELELPDVAAGVLPPMFRHGM